MKASKNIDSAVALAILFSVGAASSLATLADDGGGLEAYPVIDSLELEAAHYDPGASDVYTDGNGVYFDFYSGDTLAGQLIEMNLFGVADTSYYTIPPMEFVKEDWRDNNAVFPADGSYVYCTNPPNANSDEEFLAPLFLPSGALITRFEYFGYDAVNTEDNVARLKMVCQDSTGNPVSTDLTGEIGGSIAFNGGNFVAGTNLNVTVDNRRCAYHVWADLSGSQCQGTNERLYKARIGWNRQISSPPATNTFVDVPVSHPFFTAIEALAASEITTGCGGGRYCPDDFVTRGQMAAFLSRALGLHWEGL